MSKCDGTALHLHVLMNLCYLSCILSLLLYPMNKLQKIPAPTIVQPPPLPPVLQVATQVGILNICVMLEILSGFCSFCRHQARWPTRLDRSCGLAAGWTGAICVPRVCCGALEMGFSWTKKWEEGRQPYIILHRKQ
jgi:hypothetical protein